MSPVPTSVVDTLNGLLEAEANSIFRVVADVSPHVGEAKPDVRDALRQLHQLAVRHTRELAALIESHGGVARARHVVRGEDQHLSFLSLKFLMPKLVAEKDLILTRYENAKRTIGSDYPDVIATIARIEGEQKHYLDVLSRAAHDVTGGRYTAKPHAAPETPDE